MTQEMTEQALNRMAKNERLEAENAELREAVSYAIEIFEALDRNRVVGAQVVSRLAIKKLKAVL